MTPEQIIERLQSLQRYTRWRHELEMDRTGDWVEWEGIRNLIDDIWESIDLEDEHNDNAVKL